MPKQISMEEFEYIGKHQCYVDINDYDCEIKDICSKTATDCRLYHCGLTKKCSNCKTTGITDDGDVCSECGGNGEIPVHLL